MKININYLLIIISCLFVSISAHAAPADDLATLLNSTHTMKANFTQIIYDNRGKAIQRANGFMAMERPGKFRWEVTKPIAQVIIANQSRLWIYDPDLEQVTIRSLNTAASESPALLLSHVNHVLNKAYAIAPAASKQPGWVWYTLTPRNADSMFASIKMGFQQSQIHEMQLEDHLGHTTKITFQHALINTALPSALFVFKRPANVDVIDETKRH